MPFTKALEKYGVLSEACKTDWNAAIQTKSYPAGKELLEPDVVNSKLFFIEKGLARVYYFAEAEAEAEAREINLRFAVEGDLLCSVGSFFTQMPSTEYIQLMENSIVQMISYQDYRRLLGEYPDLGNLFRTLYEQRFIMNELRTKLVLEPNYTKRYLDFLKVYPGLLNRIRMNQLASFLGMSYSKLCHIRGELQDEEKKRLPNQ